MGEAQTNIVVIFMAVIAVIFGAIIATVIFSQLNKDKKNSVSSGKTDADKTDTDFSIEKTFVPEVTSNLSSTPESDSDLIRTPISEQVKTESPTSQAEEEEPNLQSVLKKTEENFFGRIRRAFLNTDKKAVLEAVEEILYTSDLGPSTVQKLLDTVEKELSGKEMAKIESVKNALHEQMVSILKPVHPEKPTDKVAELVKRSSEGPTVLMVVGVNGAGKTTSIGKITAQLASQNYKVLVAAGDTFRAAAGGQLKTWTDRAAGHSEGQGAVEIYWPENTTDPSAVAFDALTKAKAQNFDFVILDTAGRLHTQGHLMEELKKVKRVMTKVIPEAPHETWIVLDANSGQNALMQAKEFNQAITLSGVVLTKMDGTAKGGVALGVVDQLRLPIKLVGIGEKIHHLRSFDYTDYVDSILGR
jgi:fused signal recognition particle receptor